MKLLVCLAGTVVSVLAAVATDFTWSGGLTTGSPANAKDFADGDNWSGGAYPNAADAVADVTGAGAGAFLALTNAAVTLNKLNGSSTTLLGSQTLTIEKIGSTDPRITSVNIFTPVHVASGRLFFCNAPTVADELTVASGASILANNGALHFRDNFWAKVPSGERTFAKIGSATEYHGSYHFYSPRAAAGEWQFTLTEGSPYVTGKAGFSTYSRCSAGQFVSGPGIKDGTYVKRIFDSVNMELSQPATNSVVDVALSFAAQTVKINHPFGVLGHNGSTDHNTLIYVNRNSESEDYSVEVDTLNVYPLSGSSRKMTLATENSYIPGKLIVHNTTYPGVGLRSHIVLADCYVEFASTTYDSAAKTTPEPGFPWSEIEFNDAAKTARLGVQEGLSAVIPHFLSCKGKIEKVGPGSLIVGFADGVSPENSVTVKEGAFGFAADAEAGMIVCPSVTVKAGGTFVVPVQGVRATSFLAEPGATISGSGTLHLAMMPDLTGIAIGPHVTIAPDATGASVALTVPTAATAATMPGDPAFWIDCSQPSKMTLVTLDAAYMGSTKGVYRIDDVRKTSEDDKYLFSTNCAGNASSIHMPVLQYDARKKLHHVYFGGHRVGPMGDILNTDAHAWSKPVADIRVVFEVYGGDGTDVGLKGSAPVLGATSAARLNVAIPVGAVSAGRDVWSRYVNTACYLSWASPAMKAGEFRINGEIKDPTRDKPPYGSPLVTGQTHQYRCHPMVMDMTIPDTLDGSGKRKSHIADAYTFCPGYSDQGGVASECKRLFELIVYTNMLTRAEIISVRRYLMRKWLSQDASVAVRELNPVRVSELNGGLEIPAGDAYYADKVAGGATFTKKGAGTVYVENAYAPTASVTVSGGTLKVRSFDFSKPALNEDDLIVTHLDASVVDSDHFTYEDDAGRGVKTVTKWKDVKLTDGARSDASLWQSGSTNKPFIAENKLNGLSVLDFGPFYDFAASAKTDYESTASAMTLAQQNDMHGMIAVWGSENGGGTLLGEVGSYWSNGIGLARDQPTYGKTASDPIFRNETHQSFGNASSYLFQKNGTASNPLTTGLSGTFDIVSYACWSPFTLYALQAMDNDNRQWLGGGQIGELIVSKMGFSKEHMAEIEAYLKKKWFNQDTDGYREATLGTVSVGSGATLEVTGGGRLNVGTLGIAGGILKGDVVLLANAPLQAVVTDDGRILPVSIDGSIDLSKGGTVTFSGATAALQPGTYALLSGIGASGVGTWTVDVSTLPRRFRQNATVFVRDGKLYVQVLLGGLSVIIR